MLTISLNIIQLNIIKRLDPQGGMFETERKVMAKACRSCQTSMSKYIHGVLSIGDKSRIR